MSPAFGLAKRKKHRTVSRPTGCAGSSKLTGAYLDNGCASPSDSSPVRIKLLRFPETPSFRTPFYRPPPLASSICSVIALFAYAVSRSGLTSRQRLLIHNGSSDDETGLRRPTVQCSSLLHGCRAPDFVVSRRRKFPRRKFLVLHCSERGNDEISFMRPRKSGPWSFVAPLFYLKCS